MKKLLLLLTLFPTLLLAQPERFNLKDATCVISTSNITTATTTLAVDGTTGKEMVIYEVLLQNLSATAVLVQLQEEDGDKFHQIKLYEKMPYPFSLGVKVKKLAEGKGLNIVTDDAGDIIWTVCYGLEKN